MSSKRIFGITVFGAAVIVCVLAVMLILSFFTRESGEIALPDTSPAETQSAEPSDMDGGLTLVRVTPDTVQDVIRDLARPEAYTREITLESFWDSGSAVYTITAAVSDGVTSLRTLSGGIEKRVIVTPDTFYVWYPGDKTPYTASLSSPDGAMRLSDELQMMLTYEDMLKLNKSDILDAGFIEYNGSSCIYIDFKSQLLGYTTRCYISTALGLIMGAEEYDGETPVSRMTAGQCITDAPDETLFLLPDGKSALPVTSPGSP